MDLHLALHLKRRVNSDNQIDFLGQSWHIAPTKRSSITLIHHPLRQFWVVTEPQARPSTTGQKSSENTHSKICPLLNSRRNPLLNSRRQGHIFSLTQRPPFDLNV